jgi:hypothetical protein
LSRHLAESSARADPGPEFRVSLARLEREIGRRPVKSLYQIVDAMLVSAVTADLPQ